MPQNKCAACLLALFFVVMISGCATVPKQPSISAKKESDLIDMCAQNNILWQWDQVSHVVTLKFGGSKAQALVGSDLVLINGESITLSAPIRTVRSSIIVPADFQSKVIDRLRQGAVFQKGYGVAKIRKIIIDAGHGGKDPGAIGYTGLQEKGVVLDIAKRLAKILKEHGFKIEMTRENDEFISLEGRTEIASRANADLFVSVHANSSPSRSVYGIETYSAEDLSFIDKIASQRKTNEDLMFKNLSIKKGSPEVANIISDMLYTHKLSESELLAEQVAKQAAKLVKTKNRGAKTARFNVLRNTLIPAVLVEVGFLTNPKEEKLLKSNAYRQKVANSLAESITDYANGKQ